jgi:formate hydrogenlyase subunit 3/multisubunit Na+/H+ antiporter MnhD subunit
MTPSTLLLLILIPLVFGIASIFMPKRSSWAALLATALNLFLSGILFKQNLNLFAFLISLYSAAFMRERRNANQFYAYLLVAIAFVNGAVLADNFLVMLFFWEGLLLALFGMIAVGKKDAFKTAIKAFIILGISDLCMMVGIALTAYLSGTLTISKINLPMNGLGGLAFVLLMIGAISKAGAMPFHSWIPDAATDAPLPFMALVPAALEKLVGIYFLTRICLDIFILNPGSWASTLLMIIGAMTIILAVMMALVQKDYKRLLSYHAISQVGYMILGIGTMMPAGIIGGLFHMINNAMYKSCLFLTGGSVEKNAGTTDLEKLGGIGPKMPITFACFLITAAAISGVPPFNGFFSKELVYDGALERGLIFYLAALIGSFLTAASFLKLGHAVFLGKIRKENKNVKEAPVSMLIPMIVIAIGCVVFGAYNYLPINMLQHILGEARLEGKNFWGFPTNMTLVILSVVVLVGAFLNHLLGVKKTGSALKAADHIHYAPVLSGIYEKAEKRFFDPYDIGLKIVNIFARIGWWCDKAINWIYDTFIVRIVYLFSDGIRMAHTGNYSVYIVWSLVGTIAILIFLVR